MHFLSSLVKSRSVRTVRLYKPWAATIATVSGTQKPISLTVGNIVVMKVDVELAVLPKHIRVVDPDGKVINPSSGRVFAISIETFDPNHLVTEIVESDLQQSW